MADTKDSSPRAGKATAGGTDLQSLIDQQRQSFRDTPTIQATPVHIAQAQPESPKHASSPSAKPQAKTLRGRWVSVLALGLLGLGLAGYWWKVHESGPASPVAKKLLTVAKELDLYRNMHGSVPRHLTELKSFPADAAQWDIENFDVQMAEPKLEFFLVELEDTHVLIARSGKDVWLYDSKDQQLKQAPG